MTKTKIIALLTLLITAFAASGSTIVQDLTLIPGVDTNSVVHFQQMYRPRLGGPVTNIGSDIPCVPVNGAISNVFSQGLYDVSVGAYGCRIAVPNDSATYDILGLQTNVVASTPTGRSIFNASGPSAVFSVLGIGGDSSGNLTASSLTLNSNITAARFIGDGSGLSNVSGGAMLDVTKAPFNAHADGVTDDWAIFTNALAVSATSGLPVFVPNKTYKISSALTINTNQSLISANGAKLLFTSVSGVAITINYQASNVCLSGLEIDGGGSSYSTPSSDDGRTGVLYWNCQNPNWTLKNVYVHGFGTGVEVYGLGANTDPLGVLNDCRVRFCYTGFKVDGQAEYMSFTGLQVTENHNGLVEYGGNNTFSSCNFSRNVNNLCMGNQGNPGHVSFAACAFNHAGSYAVEATNVWTGAVFSSCAFLPCNMYITQGQGFSWNNCMIGWTNDGSGPYTITFNQCTNCAILFPENPYNYPSSYTVATTSCSNIVVQPTVGTTGGLSTGSSGPTSWVTNTASGASPSVTINWATGSAQCLLCTHTGTATVSFANGVSGSSYSLMVVQDSTGGRVVNYAISGVDYGANGQPTQTTNANSMDLLTFKMFGTSYIAGGSTGY